jgi:PTS system nitrogen regulatory IIA component
MMLDVKEVSRLLAVSEKTVYRWISGKEIPAYKIGQSYRFNRVELLEWATERKIKVSHELFAEEISPGDDLPSLTDSLAAGGIHYHVAGSSKENLLRSIVGVMPLPGDVDREFLAEALLARENLGTTAIGDRIAIPHVRNPIVFHIGSPVLSLCFLDTPIDFGALDGKPVDTVFTLMTPTVRSHLHLLSRLGYALHLPELRSIITPESTAERITAALASVEASLAGKGEGK